MLAKPVRTTCCTSTYHVVDRACAPGSVLKSLLPTCNMYDGSDVAGDQSARIIHVRIARRHNLIDRVHVHFNPTQCAWHVVSQRRTFTSLAASGMHTPGSAAEMYTVWSLLNVRVVSLTARHDAA